MKSLVAAFLLTVVIPGCGTDGVETPPHETVIDEELRPIVEDWAATCKNYAREAWCDTRGIDEIVLVNQYDDPYTIGQCTVKTDIRKKHRRLSIRRNIPRDGYYMKALMLHEMMHCRFNITSHVETGVMGAYVNYTEEEIEAKWPELLRETYELAKIAE